MESEDLQLTTACVEHQFADPLSVIQEALATGGIDAEIVAPGAPTPTVVDAAAALGVGIDAIIKSVLFVNRRGECALAIAAGTDRIDRKLLEAVTGLSKLRLANPAEVIERTGFAPGGVPPIAHRTRMPVVVDDAVMEREAVFGGAGSEQHLLRIAPSDIVQLSAAVVASIT